MILVTGAAGFVGQSLIKRLVREKKKVRALVRKQDHIDLLPVEKIEIVFGDVRDTDILDYAMEGVTSVVHLAALSSKAPEKQMFDVNVNGLKTLLQAADKHKVKHVLHYSSVAVYGEAIDVVEENEQKPYDAYGRSKKEGEKIILEFIKGSKVLVSIFRPPHIYGPGGNTNITNMFKVIKKGYYLIIGEGENLINAVYIDDIISATITLLNRKEHWGKDYIIGDSFTYKLKDFSNIIAETCGARKPIRVPKTLGYSFGLGFDVLHKVTKKRMPLSRSRAKNIMRSRSYVIEKAEKDLDYHPKVHFPEGAKISYKWYLENKLL